MHLFFSRDIGGRQIILPDDESIHCIRVLRLKKGNEAGVLDGKGNLFHCLISDPDPGKTTLEIQGKEFTEPDPWQIHLAIAPTKNMNRTEWFVEKATELGIHEISFIRCSRSERKIIKTDRLDKILISALKQSKRRYLPVVHPVTDFQKFIHEIRNGSDKFIGRISESPDENLFDAAIPARKYLLLIGPEGDFDPGEFAQAIQFNFKPVSLGKNILRTETAGIAGVHILNLVNQIRK